MNVTQIFTYLALSALLLNAQFGAVIPEATARERCSTCNGTGKVKNPWPSIASGAYRDRDYYTGCRSCYGTGYEPSAGHQRTPVPSRRIVGWDRCPHCNGSGQKVFLVDLSGRRHSTQCPFCSGRGKTARYGSTSTITSSPSKHLAKINSVAQVHNITRQNSKGMVVHVAFEVIGVKGQQGQVAAYFEFSNGRPLKDFDDIGRYCSVNGNVLVWGAITPKYDHTVWNDYQLFIPYSQLHLAEGRHDLRFHVEVHDSSGNMLATSNNVYFKGQWP